MSIIMQCSLSNAILFHPSANISFQDIDGSYVDSMLHILLGLHFLVCLLPLCLLSCLCPHLLLHLLYQHIMFLAIVITLVLMLMNCYQFLYLILIWILVHPVRVIFLFFILHVLSSLLILLETYLIFPTQTLMHLLLFFLNLPLLAYQSHIFSTLIT